MKSPFPGMDPFIEGSGLWEGFHNHLINAIAESLADRIPHRYLVRAGERSYILFVESKGKVRRPFVPDVSLALTRKKSAGHGTAVAEPGTEIEPVNLRAFIEEEHREAFIDIFETSPARGARGKAKAGRLVTTIEVLSPVNKRPRTRGWKLYQRKRQSCLLGGVNIVEIDLVRSGERMPMVDPWPDVPYTLLVARAKEVPMCQVWPVQLLQHLPAIPVPLAKPDADVPLTLEPLIDAIYQRYRYGKSIDYSSSLTPQLSAEEASLSEKHLRVYKASRPKSGR